MHSASSCCLVLIVTEKYWLRRAVGKVTPYWLWRLKHPLPHASLQIGCFGKYNWTFVAFEDKDPQFSLYLKMHRECTVNRMTWTEETLSLFLLFSLSQTCDNKHSPASVDGNCACEGQNLTSVSAQTKKASGFPYFWGETWIWEL